MDSLDFIQWVEEEKDTRFLKITTGYENYGTSMFIVIFRNAPEDEDTYFEMTLKVQHLEATVLDENGNHVTIWQHIKDQAEAFGG